MMKIVGFDLDDTLVPEVLFIRSGIHAIAPEIHEKHPSIPTSRIINRMEAAVATRQNHYSALESLFKEYSLSDSADMKGIVNDFRSHRPDPAIYHLAPSMQEELDRLKNAGIRMILVTDGRSLTQRNKIAAAALDRYFDDSDIYISEETGHDKTDPDTFLRIMERYAGASEFHFVGDNPDKDFIHPSRLGWKVHQAHRFPLMIHQGMPR